MNQVFIGLIIQNIIYHIYIFLVNFASNLQFFRIIAHAFIH
jgi:hypothetical protein